MLLNRSLWDLDWTGFANVRLMLDELAGAVPCAGGATGGTLPACEVSASPFRAFLLLLGFGSHW